VTALAVTGWALALLLAVATLSQRRRLALAADAEHELRGAIGAIALGVGAAGDFDLELARARAGLDDLAAARGERRPASPPIRLGPALAAAARRAGARMDWGRDTPDVAAPGGRVAQIVANLLANAVEHGGGRVVVRARRVGGRVRIVVSDSGRGRGLSIVDRAARECGGTVTVDLPAAREP
jgi:hypothetical protein